MPTPELTLYTTPFSRGTYAVWMLKECAAPCNIVALSADQLHEADYLAVNPLGKVPALKAGGTILPETIAIITYLAEQFPEKNLIPAAGSIERGEYYRWLCFSIQLEYACMDKFFDRPSDHPRFRTGIGYGSFEEAFGVLRKHLSEHDYIVGGRFSALDLYYAALLLHFSRNMQVLDTADPIFSAYIERHTARPAFAETMAWAQQAAAELGE